MNIFDTNQKWYSFCYAWNLIWATFDSIFVSHLLGFPIARSINTNSIHYCDRSSRIFGFLNELVSFILTDEFTFRFFFIKKKNKINSYGNEEHIQFYWAIFHIFYEEIQCDQRNVLVWHVPFIFNEAWLILPSFMIDQPTFFLKEEL